MSWHPCPYQMCLDNVHGQCFAGGCSRNPERPSPDEEPDRESDE